MEERSTPVADRRPRRLWRFLRWAMPALFAAGAGFAVVWLVAVGRGVYEPLAETPLLAAVACTLGALALAGTFRVGVAARYRVDAPGARRVWLVTTAGVVSLAVLVVVSLSSIAVALPHFFRSWPISPANAGSVLFYALAGLVVVPIVVALALLVTVVTGTDSA